MPDGQQLMMNNHKELAMRQRRISKYFSAGAAALALVLGTGAAAAADVPSLNPLPVVVAGRQCLPQDLVAESGGSDIVTGSQAYYAPTRDGAGNLAGGGTFTFKFVLAAKSCSQLTYQVDLFDDADGTPVTTGTASADPNSGIITTPTLTVPSSYKNKRVLVVAQTVNPLGQTLDRAPDSGTAEVCAVDSTDGCSQNFR